MVTRDIFNLDCYSDYNQINRVHVNTDTAADHIFWQTKIVYNKNERIHHHQNTVQNIDWLKLCLNPY